MKSRSRPAGSWRSRYQARDGAIVGRNGGLFFNRPLYLANTNAFVLAGDRPVLRFASGGTLHGTLFFGVVRGGRNRWLHEAAEQVVEFCGGRVRWTLHDPAWTGLKLHFEVVVAAEGVGFALQLGAVGARPGDRLVWAFGGAHSWSDKNLNWECDPYRAPPLLADWFDPALCSGNLVQLEAWGGTVTPGESSALPVRLVCDGAGPSRVAEAAWPVQPAEFLSVPAATRPILAGEIDLATQSAAHWACARLESGVATAVAQPAEVFAAGLAHARDLAGRLVVETPDERLNAAAAALPAAVNGLWYPPVFRHGAMLWNNRYPGWRTVYGGTVLGWLERVKAQAEFYGGHQVTADEKRSTASDPKLLHTIPAKDSRFFGRGRILEDQGIYNMQSQFFDQLIHAWRWSGDAGLAAQLRPMLELHLEWLRECFDPDDDGLYESVINVWPTDSVWYAGGGATEETAYAFRAHTAAAELARLGGDGVAAQRHRRRAARIRAAFQRKLWIARRGHAGLYREQPAPQRLHEDAWLYSIFLPIDAGLLGPEQAAESLLYAERSLQNDRMPGGGRQVWTSNFVPGIWSVRERWPGDNHHLALAYFQVGLGEDGWDIFRGTFLHTAFDQIVPGDFGAPAGGTDFGDSTHMFARALVEGLFGLAPDRAAGVVRITPQLPPEWKRAALRTPDVALSLHRRGATTTLDIELTRAAGLAVRLPICAREVRSVTANGRPMRWRAEPGFGRTWICVDLMATTKVSLVVTAGGAAEIFGPTAVSGRAGSSVRLNARAASIDSFSDPQGVLAEAVLRRGRLTGRLTANPGWHTVLVRVNFGELPQLRRFHVHIADVEAQKTAAAAKPGRVSARARWRCVDLAPALNGDVRTIYAQRYLSPRPPTISARLGSDGYSPWTFLYWDSHPPVIRLDAAESLLDPVVPGRLRTPQGVPFAWAGGERNIAFTSRWDNWPKRVTVPVNLAGDAVWFLLCGSTNPMQNRIANAVLRLRYASGPDDALELVPPFNYWNLSPIRPNITAPGQDSRCDYTAETDAFCVPKPWPETVQLGENCRAILLGRRLRRGTPLRRVTLETLSPEVVVGLMGVTVMNPR